jgi:hypothetical protein
VNSNIAILCRSINSIYYCESLGDKQAINFTLPESSLILFKHNLKETLICDSGQFQVHVWGKDKYTLWELPRGSHTCVLLRGVYLDACGDFYVASREPNACREIDVSPCELKLSKILVQLGSSLFLLVGLNVEQEVLNILEHGIDESKCLNRLNKVKRAFQEEYGAKID